MAKIKIQNVSFRAFGPARREEDGGDSAVVQLRLKMKAPEARAVMASRESRREFGKLLIEEGYADAPGCYCSHCQNDWDCCGRMVPGSPRLVRKGYGLLVEQHYDRNI